MFSDVFGGMFIYIAPVVGIALLAPRVKLSRSVLLALLFGAPALGCMTYIASVRMAGLDRGFSPWRDFELYYPLTILPLGLWAMFLGSLGAFVLARIRTRPLSHPTVGCAGGAVGIGFVRMYLAIPDIGTVAPDHSRLVAWLAADALAGALSAVAIAADVSTDAALRDQAHQ